MSFVLLVKHRAYIIIIIASDSWRRGGIGDCDVTSLPNDYIVLCRKKKQMYLVIVKHTDAAAFNGIIYFYLQYAHVKTYGARRDVDEFIIGPLSLQLKPTTTRLLYILPLLMILEFYITVRVCILSYMFIIGTRA